MSKRFQPDQNQIVALIVVIYVVFFLLMALLFGEFK